MAWTKPLAEQRRTVAVYPAGTIMSIVGDAYDGETVRLAEGVETNRDIILPSGRRMYMSPRLRTLHLLGTECCNCGVRALQAVEKRTAHPDRSMIIFVDSANILKCTSIQADHVIPESRGGPSDLGNLVPLCMRCNSRKGDRETHTRERRWRVRTLMEAALCGENEKRKAEITERYNDYRKNSFQGSRRVAAYNLQEVLNFFRIIGTDRISPDGIPFVEWPAAISDSIPEDPWLAELANAINGTLLRLAAAPEAVPKNEQSAHSETSPNCPNNL